MPNIKKIFNKDYSILAILIICFLLLRLSLLLTDIKHLEMDEEAVCGVLANDVMSNNIKLSTLDYQHMPYCGDTLIVSFFAIPFFLIFGNSIISLKLIPLFFSLGTLILWYLFLNKYISRTVAILMSLLLIVPPPHYTILTLCAAIPHTEINFFSIAIIFLFFKVIYAFYEKGKPKDASLILLIFLGVISGLAVYANYTISITFLTCLMLWFAIDKRFILKKYFSKLSLFFLIGLIPWIAANIYFFPAGIKGLTPYYPYEVSRVLKPLKLLIYNLPHSFGFGFNYTGDTGINLQSVIYYVIFFLCFGLLLLFYRKPLLTYLKAMLPSNQLEINSKAPIAILLILVFPFVFLLFFSISGFDIAPIFAFINAYDLTKHPDYLYRYRYLVPFYPFIFAIISLALGEVGLKSKNTIYRYITFGAIFYLLALGFYSNYKLISWDKFGQGFIYKGYRERYLVYDIVQKNWSFQKISALISDLEEDAKFHGYSLLGEKVAQKHADNLSLAIDKIEKVPIEYRHCTYFGLFSYLTKVYWKDQKRIISQINMIPGKYKSYCYEAYGFELAYKLLKSRNNAYDLIQSLSKVEKALYPEISEVWKKPKWDVAHYIDSINKIEEAYQPFCYIGFGKFLAMEDAENHIEKHITTINKIDENYRKYCYLGFGQQLVERFYYLNPSLLPLGQIDKPFQKFLFEEIDIHLNRIFSLTRKIDKSFKPYVYEGLGIAIRKYFEEEAVLNHTVNKVDIEYRKYYLKGLYGKE
jgi:4-amino-4-deoxy-L-arabinose transferase-like glycosyltransferase